MAVLELSQDIARAADARGDERESWIAAYRQVRQETERRVAPLGPEDQAVQSMEDASPAKWHRAHTSWFFEEFLLCRFERGYRAYAPGFRHLFNSYYDTVGARHPRAKRGLLTRPTAEEVAEYRGAIDAAMARWIRRAGAARWRETLPLLALGLAHEEQHQELILTDILHAFAENPLDPVYDASWSDGAAGSGAGAMAGQDGGVYVVGADDTFFAFDNERPRHRVHLEPFRIGKALVTNGEWLRFIAEGGYDTPTLWLSDGWAEVARRGWRAPEYWREDEPGRWSVMTLAGRVPVDPEKPVCHVSYYEADAFARWSGKRLPTEQEWEVAARAGLLADAFGTRWQWTASPYAAYPGFRAAAGAVGEYNGKFMVNQMVLRGGSIATPPGHARDTYRNFFYPHQRWQFTGLRLADT